MIQIDDLFDFPQLVEPLGEYYCRDQGRPAIPPEVLVRALLISSLYEITSFRRLCSANSENIAFRWFCFLTIDDKVFDHSTISYFIKRVGNEGFGEIFQLFNEELLRLGLLSRKVYADSSLVRANVSWHDLSPSGKTVSATYQEEMVIRRTTAEGVFASQDRLGWARSRLRRLRKVDCEGYMSALAHNLKKAVRRLESSTGPPEPRRVVAAVGALSG